jgi:hypothetical protein
MSDEVALREKAATLTRMLNLQGTIGNTTKQSSGHICGTISQSNSMCRAPLSMPWSVRLNLGRGAGEF